MEGGLASCVMWLAILLHCTLTLTPGPQTSVPQKVGEGLSWMDIYNRSQCKPRWVLLNLLTELPQLSDYLFLPSCVSVQRCAGCCDDEELSCIPSQTHSVIMQVMKTKSLQTDLMNISVTQHTSCQCRPKSSVQPMTHRLSKLGEQRVKKRRRKGKKGRETPQTTRPPCPSCKNHRTLNPVTCECACRHVSEEKCHQQGQRFNRKRCRCEQLRG
ncbi:vascular endothelial growth factor B [Rhinophrynus dorsalis]